MSTERKKEAFIQRIQSVAEDAKVEHISVKYRHKPGYGLSDLYQGNWRNITSGLYINSSSYIFKHFLTDDLEFLLLSVRQMDDRKKTMRFDFTRIFDRAGALKALKLEYDSAMTHKSAFGRSSHCALVLYSADRSDEIRPLWAISSPEMNALMEMRVDIDKIRDILQHPSNRGKDFMTEPDFMKLQALLEQYTKHEYSFVEQSMQKHLR